MGVARNSILMSKDIPVISMNFDSGLFEVLNERLLPFNIKGRLRELPTPTGNQKYDLSILMNVSNKNRYVVAGWLANRTLLLSRKNAKWLYNLLHEEQLDTLHQRCRISLLCRSVSVLDCYWVKLEGDPITWDKVDPTRNHLNEIVAQVALHGKSLTLQGSLTTPEFTTNGTYAKAWRRHGDGSLWLYKLGSQGSLESEKEVMCSDLLDKMSVKHVHYKPGFDDGKYVCMCPSMTTDKLGILPAMDYNTYCINNGINFIESIVNLDPDGYYSMIIVDYLISNRDRHDQNWGLYYDKDSMELISLHPLFDHNNAFDEEWMNDPNVIYQVTGRSIRESAKYAISKMNFRFTDRIDRSDFLTNEQWESFKYRAQDLGLM